MKKKFASQSVPARHSFGKDGFFNVRILIGSFVVLVGVFLALAGSGVLAQGFAKRQNNNRVVTHSDNPLVPVPFDCSNIDKFAIDKQVNLRAGAIMMACGELRNNSISLPSAFGAVGRFLQKLFTTITPTPQAYGGTDVDLITGPEISPNITQSTTYSIANPDNPSQILVAYNDTRGANANPPNGSGASWSSDGGNTFVRLTGSDGQSPFHGTGGEPVALYHRPTQTWYTIWYDTLCSGLGGYSTATPGDVTSWTHFCVVTSPNSIDRASGWLDNNPTSPFYGRMYVSYNNFSVGGGALFVRWSSDAGATWNQAQLTASFVRNVQITGDISGNGSAYLAAMDEGGGGFPHNDTNYIFKSTDGGNTWTNTYGPGSPTFPGPGVTATGYFACMFPDNGCFWRHEGWGEPAAFNNVVHLVYAQHGAGNDAGDVYYIRSTDGGFSFSAPFKLNTDNTTRPQWEPNISVSPTGTLFATWYDGRENPTCALGNPSVPCYRMWSRKSTDNGATWLPDDALSDAQSPLPAPDPGSIGSYASDYDYGSAIGVKHVTSWVDGRVTINGQSQQDAFTDRELVGFSVTTACPNVINYQPTDFSIDLTDSVDPATVQATDFTVNGIPANSFVLMNGNTTIIFHFNSSPVTTEGFQTMHIPAGAFSRASDHMPNLEFTCTFCYAVTPLQVTSTNPPVGGTFSPPAPADYTYDVNFNQPVDAASIQTSDLMLSGSAVGSVTNVTLVNSNTTARFTLHFSFGGTLTASIRAGSIIANACNRNAAFSGDYTVQGCPPADHYIISQVGGSIVPGTTDIGNHGDDQVTNVALPFSYTLYDQTYNSVNLSSNGNAQFTTTDTSYINSCLPWTNHNYTVYPYWDDLYLVNAGFGIFTSISGTAPNRIFNIEWRAQYYPGSGTANFELRLYEGQTRFDVIYGTVTNANTSATAGVQKNDTTFDQYFCNGSGNPATGGQSYIATACNLVSVAGAVSRETHGSAGTFDIDMPLTGSSGVECRTTGGTNDYTLVVTFSSNVTVTGNPQAEVTSGTGCVGMGGVCSGNVSINGAVVTVPLTNIANAQLINVRINGVNGVGSDLPVTNFDIPMGFLIGDTNANRAVNAADIAMTKNQIGQPVSAANFRDDVNANGSISASDAALVKQHAGEVLPP